MIQTLSNSVEPVKSPGPNALVISTWQKCLDECSAVIDQGLPLQFFGLVRAVPVEHDVLDGHVLVAAPRRVLAIERLEKRDVAVGGQPDHDALVWVASIGIVRRRAVKVIPILQNQSLRYQVTTTWRLGQPDKAMSVQSRLQSIGVIRYTVPFSRNGSAKTLTKGKLLSWELKSVLVCATDRSGIRKSKRRIDFMIFLG